LFSLLAPFKERNWWQLRGEKKADIIDYRLSSLPQPVMPTFFSFLSSLPHFPPLDSLKVDRRHTTLRIHNDIGDANAPSSIKPLFWRNVAHSCEPVPWQEASKSMTD
jgi:hypothetical protein